MKDATTRGNQPIQRFERSNGASDVAGDEDVKAAILSFFAYFIISCLLDFEYCHLWPLTAMTM